jgi:ubiquinone/menaquinone biosynthesis C-methylase UbiE
LLAGANEGVEVVGVDAAPQMIDRARTTDVTVTNAAYHVAGFDDLPIGDDWADRVFSMEALYYAADLDCAIAEIRRVLVPGGWAEILIDYFEESPASEPWAEVTGADLHRLSEAGWRARFRTAGFDPVTLSRVYDPRPVDASPCDECEPTLEAKIALREAGTLWIRATKPAEVL